MGVIAWQHTVPVILHTLFERYDFSGRTIIPFHTRMGGWRQWCPPNPSKAGPEGEGREGFGGGDAEWRKRGQAVARALEIWWRSGEGWMNEPQLWAAFSAQSSEN